MIYSVDCYMAQNTGSSLSEEASGEREISTDMSTQLSEGLVTQELLYWVLWVEVNSGDPWWCPSAPPQHLGSRDHCLLRGGAPGGMAALPTPTSPHSEWTW